MLLTPNSSERTHTIEMKCAIIDTTSNTPITLKKNTHLFILLQSHCVHGLCYFTHKLRVTLN